MRSADWICRNLRYWTLFRLRKGRPLTNCIEHVADDKKMLHLIFGHASDQLSRLSLHVYGVHGAEIQWDGGEFDGEGSLQQVS